MKIAHIPVTLHPHLIIFTKTFLQMKTTNNLLKSLTVGSAALLTVCLFGSCDMKNPGTNQSDTITTGILGTGDAADDDAVQQDEASTTRTLPSAPSRSASKTSLPVLPNCRTCDFPAA